MNRNNENENNEQLMTRRGFAQLAGAAVLALVGGAVIKKGVDAIREGEENSVEVAPEDLYIKAGANIRTSPVAEKIDIGSNLHTQLRSPLLIEDAGDLIEIEKRYRDANGAWYQILGETHAKLSDDEALALYVNHQNIHTPEKPTAETD